MGTMSQYQNGWTMHFTAQRIKREWTRLETKQMLLQSEKMYWAMIASRKRVKKAWNQTNTAKSLIDDAVEEIIERTMHIGKHFAIMLRKFMKKFCKLTEIKHEHRQIAQQTLSILATLPPAIQKMHEKRDLNSALLTLKLVERCVMKAEELTDSKEKFDDPPAENLHGLLSDLKPLIISLKKCDKDMSHPKSEEVAWKAAQEAD